MQHIVFVFCRLLAFALSVALVVSCFGIMYSNPTANNVRPKSGHGQIVRVQDSRANHLKESRKQKMQVKDKSETPSIETNTTSEDQRVKAFEPQSESEDPNGETYNSTTIRAEDVGGLNEPGHWCDCAAFNETSNFVPNASAANQGNSTCSEWSTLRGPGQKLVTFSLFGRDPERVNELIHGLRINMPRIRSIYKGFVVRLYHDMNKSDENDSRMVKRVCKITCQNLDILDLCDVNNLDTLGNIRASEPMVWRFSPMADPLVSQWHSRDLDALVIEREFSAMEEWDASNKTFHVMRDHPYHEDDLYTYVLGGMFGMKMPPSALNRTAPILNNMLNDNRTAFEKTNKTKGFDEFLITKYLCPWISLDSMAHDSYNCLQRGCRGNGTVVRPYPTQRADGSTPNYVGNYMSNYTLTWIRMERYGPCPEICRPKEHKDWLLC